MVCGMWVARWREREARGSEAERAQPGSCSVEVVPVRGDGIGVGPPWEDSLGSLALLDGGGDITSIPGEGGGGESRSDCGSGLGSGLRGGGSSGHSSEVIRGSALAAWCSSMALCAVCRMRHSRSHAGCGSPQRQHREAAVQPSVAWGSAQRPQVTRRWRQKRLPWPKPQQLRHCRGTGIHGRTRTERYPQKMRVGRVSPRKRRRIRGLVSPSTLLRSRCTAQTPCVSSS